MRLEAARGPTDTAAGDAPTAVFGWVWIVSGALMFVLGALLVFTPGRTLAFVATLVGISLCVTGVLDLVAALGRVFGRPRAGGFATGVVSVAAGIVIIARPEGSVRAVAVIAGLCLIAVGVATLVLGRPGLSRGRSLPLGAVALAAGIALLAAPDTTVGLIGIMFGAFLLVCGAAELTFGARLLRAGRAP